MVDCCFVCCWRRFVVLFVWLFAMWLIIVWLIVVELIVVGLV